MARGQVGRLKKREGRPCAASHSRAYAVCARRREGSPVCTGSLAFIEPVGLGGAVCMKMRRSMSSRRETAVREERFSLRSNIAAETKPRVSRDYFKANLFCCTGILHQFELPHDFFKIALFYYYTMAQSSVQNTSQYSGGSPSWLFINTNGGGVRAPWAALYFAHWLKVTWEPNGIKGFENSNAQPWNAWTCSCFNLTSSTAPRQSTTSSQN